MNKYRPSTIHLFTLCLIGCLGFELSAAATSCQDEETEPKTFLDIAKVKQKLVQEFRANPQMPADEKIARVSEMVELEKKAIQGLESADPAFVEGIKQSPKQLMALTRQGTISNSFLLGRLYQEKGEYAQSVKAMEYALANSRALYGDNDWHTFEYILQLSISKWLSEASEQQLAQWASVKTANRQGLQDYGKKKFADARENLQKAKATLEQLQLEESMIYGETIANLAEAMAMSGKVAESEAMFRKAIEVNDALFKKRSPTNASMRVSFSRIYRQLGQTDKALDVLKEGEQILKDVYGENSFQLAQNLFIQGTVNQQAKKLSEARDLYFAAFKMLNGIGQRNHQLTLSLLSNLRDLYVAVGQHQDAAATCETAGKISTAVFGQNHPRTADWLLYTANSRRVLGEHEKSVELCRQAKLIYEKGPGYVKNPSYISCVNTLAMNQFALGKKDEALQLAKEAADLAKAYGGPESMFYAFRAQNLAYLYNRTGKYDEAEALFAEILPIIGKQLGTQHAEYLKNTNDRALNLFQQEKWKESATLWVQLKDLQAKTIGTGHAEYQSTLRYLVDAYEKSGDAETAKKIREEIAKTKKEKEIDKK